MDVLGDGCDREIHRWRDVATRASMQIEPSSDQVKALLASASGATRALGGKTESRD
jgi:hypothetical protein